jgi:uncharacterized membrane protein
MENKQNKKLLSIVYTSMAIALVTLSTMVIRIPTIKGYINFGDIMIFVTAILLGKKSGFLAGAFGSALADILSSYVIYAPGTFIIKGLEGLICALLVGINSDNRINTYSLIIAPIISGLWMVFGYFIYEYILFGIGTAFPDIFTNLIQGGVSAIAAIPIILTMKKMNFSLSN